MLTADDVKRMFQAQDDAREAEKHCIFCKGEGETTFSFEDSFGNVSRKVELCSGCKGTGLAPQHNERG